jgi:hypothetical protein
LKHTPLVSFTNFLNLATWLPSLNLAAKFELGSQIGSQVQTWQMSQKELIKNIVLRPKNLAAKLELGRACAKFKLGCQVQNLAKIRNLAGTWQDQMARVWYCSTISYNMNCPK